LLSRSIRERYFYARPKLDDMENRMPREIKEVLLKAVRIPETRHRNFDENRLQAIFEAVSDIGIQNPISVVRVPGMGKKYELVDGRYRLECAKRLGWNTLPALVLKSAELREKWEIASNLHRIELTTLERAEHMARYAELTKTAFSGQPVRKGRPPSGVSEAARRMPGDGSSFDARRKMLERATKIASIFTSVKKLAVEKGLDDNAKVLLEVASHPDEVGQIECIRRLAQVTGSATGANKKSPLANSQKNTKSPVEPPKVETLLSAWNRSHLFRAVWNAAAAEVQHEFYSKHIGKKSAANWL
jgi:hypothetical protein